MKATYTQQILARKLGADPCDPTLAGGNLVLVGADVALSNDVTAPVAIDVFEKSGCGFATNAKSRSCWTTSRPTAISSPHSNAR